MEVLRTAKQKSAIVDDSQYSELDLKALESLGYIYRTSENSVYRVDLSIGDRLTVVYDEYDGFYSTVVKKKSNGLTIYVTL